jgi:uncharacterized protein YjbI with pentapeptide repeats
LIKRSPELEKILEAHSLWGRTKGAEGTRLDLSDADLSGADLTRADLFCADLARADLSGADLSRAYLSQVNFSRAYMRGVNLSDADLTGAILPSAKTISNRGGEQTPANPGGPSALQGDLL